MPGRLAAATAASPGPHRQGTGCGPPPRLLAFVATAGDEDQAAVLVLVAKLAELAIAVAELRDAERHTAQASAAPAAAGRLHAATCAGPAWARTANPRPTVHTHRRAGTAADLAELDFPAGAKPTQTVSSCNSRQGPGQAPRRVVPCNHGDRADPARSAAIPGRIRRSWPSRSVTRTPAG